ncbi:Hydrogenase expression/formation protein HypD [Planctomycetes bacterium Pan216]|uniref:Hydrogenase expression/formation protein HypD n=1 Tax=Kolteria novifilia TaxID=2527975 RepID=A0A518BBR1_9BACT|nr:Hydrogenase expression/formation protein HypD [Planctomycetes bacterium Pan216]
MKFVDEFRDADLIRRAAREIHKLATKDRTYRIMEICGGHTHSIFRFGLADLLPENVELIHGPGCPVCVLPKGRMDEGLEMAEDPNVILTTFGDMMRVPGSKGSPLESKARGVSVRMVYSPLDALKIAKENPEREVIFFAIGFETTAPSTALTLRQARAQGISNFAVYCNHVLVMPALRALLDDPAMRLDAFIGPGHVSTVIGCRPYEFIARDYRRPVVISGFEPSDLLQSIVMILRQLNAEEPSIENQYRRSVPQEGNRAALAVMEEVFEVRDTFEWRGLGLIPKSAMKLREAYAPWDAEARVGIKGLRVLDPEGAQCGEVLTGRTKPHECRLFGHDCTPETPVGALMVSSEGACAAQYRYGRRPNALT